MGWDHEPGSGNRIRTTSRSRVQSTAAVEDESQDRPHAEGDADGFIGIAPDTFVGGVQLGTRPVLRFIPQFSSVREGTLEASARRGDLFVGDVGSGGDQGPSILRESASIVSKGFRGFVVCAHGHAFIHSLATPTL